MTGITFALAALALSRAAGVADITVFAAGAGGPEPLGTLPHTPAADLGGAVEAAIDGGATGLELRVRRTCGGLETIAFAV